MTNVINQKLVSLILIIRYSKFEKIILLDYPMEYLL
jgi:hypothetical protein